MAIFDRVVCLVDGSPESFAALRLGCSVASPSARIVAVVPVDLAAAARAGCQVGTVALAWNSQAELIRGRAADTLREVWGYARIVEGSRITAVVRAASQEDSTTVVAAVGSLGRGGVRSLLRATEGSILIYGGPPPTGLLVPADDELRRLANGLRVQLGIAAGAVRGLRSETARGIVGDSRPGDLVVIHGERHPGRWSRPVSQSVATRTGSSVLIVRLSDSDRVALACTPGNSALGVGADRLFAESVEHPA